MGPVADLQVDHDPRIVTAKVGQQLWQQILGGIDYRQRNGAGIATALLM